jgi:hypothetical protein
VNERTAAGAGAAAIGAALAAAVVLVLAVVLPQSALAPAVVGPADTLHPFGGAGIAPDLGPTARIAVLAGASFTHGGRTTSFPVTIGLVGIALAAFAAVRFGEARQRPRSIVGAVLVAVAMGMAVALSLTGLSLGAAAGPFHIDPASLARRSGTAAFLGALLAPSWRDLRLLLVPTAVAVWVAIGAGGTVAAVIAAAPTAGAQLVLFEAGAPFAGAPPLPIAGTGTVSLLHLGDAAWWVREAVLIGAVVLLCVVASVGVRRILPLLVVVVGLGVVGSPAFQGRSLGLALPGALLAAAILAAAAAAGAAVRRRRYDPARAEPPSSAPTDSPAPQPGP